MQGANRRRIRLCCRLLLQKHIGPSLSLAALQTSSVTIRRGGRSHFLFFFGTLQTAELSLNGSDGQQMFLNDCPPTVSGQPQLDLSPNHSNCWLLSSTQSRSFGSSTQRRELLLYP
mmetsp:Transcript_13672/g.31082  ORF Transcript_13672/g.31082 Transcript_13672/m.31082 type:complete len:116 (+) Transcript_13672:248-595(+)